MEEFRIIAGHEKYEISNLGRVRNIRNGVFRKNVLKPTGYMSISLNRKTMLVHRLVALAFIKNPLEKPKVDHINNVRSDNRVSNLRWATSPENGANSLLSKKNTSGHKGVRWDDILGVWYVNLPCKVWGSRIYKQFDHVEDAIIFRFTMFTNRYGMFVNKAELADYNFAIDKFLLRMSG